MDNHLKNKSKMKARYAQSLTRGHRPLLLLIVLLILLASYEAFQQPEPPGLSSPPPTPREQEAPYLTRESHTITIAGENVVSSPKTQQSLLNAAEVFNLVESSVVSIQIQTDGLPGGPYGQASGFVIDRDGHIVTNNHVVGEASDIEITFLDGTIVKAILVGRDRFSDLAVLKVDMPADDLFPVTIGDSLSIQVGEPVVAIGNPFGLSGSLTAGIVSQLGRLLPATNRFSIPDIIQVDAAINPGNSGGPLLNMRGEVIGVNTALASGSGLFSGVGFAVPANTMNRVVPSLISDGTYRHPWLGIAGTDILPDIAEALALEGTKGVLLVEVFRDGPADRAGLRVGTSIVTINGHNLPSDADIIVGIDGHPVRKIEDILVYLQRNKSVGDIANLEVNRDGSVVNIPLILGERPPP